MSHLGVFADLPMNVPDSVVVVVAMLMVVVMPVVMDAKHRHVYPGNNLVFGQSRSEGTLEKILCRDGTGATWSLYVYGGVQGGQHRAPIRSRVGMGQVAANSSPISYRLIANSGRHFSQHGVGALYLSGRSDLMVSGKTTDVDGVAVNADTFQVRYAANIHQQG